MPKKATAKEILEQAAAAFDHSGKYSNLTVFPPHSRATKNTGIAGHTACYGNQVVEFQDEKAL